MSKSSNNQLNETLKRSLEDPNNSDEIAKRERMPATQTSDNAKTLAPNSNKKARTDVPKAEAKEDEPTECNDKIKDQTDGLVRTPEEACVVMGIPTSLANSRADLNTEEQDDEDDVLSISSSSPDDALRNLVNTILQAALVKSGVETKLKNMDAAMQAQMATKISTAKEKLIEKLAKITIGQGGGENDTVDVVTPEHIKTCMEELGKELQGL